MTVEAAKNILFTAEADPQTTLLALRRLIEYDEIAPEYEEILIDYELKLDEHPAWEEVVEVFTDAIASLPSCEDCKL